MTRSSDITRALGTVAEGTATDLQRRFLLDAGLDVLPEAAEFLRRDLSMDEVERVESVIKALLRTILLQPASGPVARAIATFQQELGFLLKYKSYTIKACTLLGYSIFLHNQGEGFSFQQHTAHKTELFHFLDVGRGGFAFVCDYDTWASIYTPESFSSWLGGRPDQRYEPFRIVPCRGDVILIDRLHLVHSVIGCVVEEFATTSVDMVDRLHDQNALKRVPPQFTREYALQRLRSLTPPVESNIIRGTLGSRLRAPVVPTIRDGVSVLTLADGVIRAARYMLKPGSATPLAWDDAYMFSVHVMRGSGRVVVADYSEVGRSECPSLSVGPGSLILLPPGVRYGFVCDGAESMVVSLHGLPMTLALA